MGLSAVEVVDWMGLVRHIERGMWPGRWVRFWGVVRVAAGLVQKYEERW